MMNSSTNSSTNTRMTFPVSSSTSSGNISTSGTISSTRTISTSESILYGNFLKQMQDSQKKEKYPYTKAADKRKDKIEPKEMKKRKDGGHIMEWE